MPFSANDVELFAFKFYSEMYKGLKQQKKSEKF